MKKSHTKINILSSTSKNPTQGNNSEGSKDYKDPVGSDDKSTPPKNSGYDEKQPKNNP